MHQLTGFPWLRRGEKVDDGVVRAGLLVLVELVML